MGPFRFTQQEARTLTALLLILLAGLAGMIIWGNDHLPADHVAEQERE